jgi:manganese/zinc/iron transport system ATP- binding protein
MTNVHISLTLDNVSVNINNKRVLESLDVSVPSGKLCAIVGPNGAGKSTLMKTILGMQPHASGEIRIFGESLEKRRRSLGYVPQKESVDWDFPISVADVVLMGTYSRLGMFARPGKAEYALVERCLEQLQISDLRNRQISELSGGQQQRVFLARALAQQADIYFMDEPFVGVDAATERNIVELMKTERDRGTSLFVVHHDLQTVPQYFDHIIMLNQRLIAAGPIADVFNAENLHKTYGGTLHFLRQSGVAEPLGSDTP